MSVDTGDTGGSEEFSFADIDSPFDDSGSADTSTQEVSGEGADSASNIQQGDNPAWNPILEGLPESFQQMLKPRLEKQDADLRKKFEDNAAFRKQFEPYEPIVKSGVQPQVLNASLQLAQQLQNDPVGLYENLRDRLISQGRIQEAQNVQNQIDDLEENEEGEEEYDDPYEQQLAELRQGQEQMREFLAEQQAQREYNEELNRATQEINSDFATIEQKVGRSLDPALKQRTVQEAQMLSQQQGRPVSVVEAFQSLTAFVAQTRRSAPRVLPPNQGGHVQPQAKKAEEMDAGDRKAWFAEYIQNQ